MIRALLFVLALSVPAFAIDRTPPQRIAPASVSTVSSVVSSASSVQLLAANVNRIGVILYNDSTQVAYVAFAATASSSAYTLKMAPGSHYESEPSVYTGVISAVWASANGSMRITELR
jgi:hypothetical protein